MTRIYLFNANVPPAREMGAAYPDFWAFIGGTGGEIGSPAGSGLNPLVNKCKLNKSMSPVVTGLQCSRPRYRHCGVL